MRFLTLIACLALAACSVSTPSTSPVAPSAQPQNRAEAQVRANRAVRNFVQVVDDVEPVAEAVCRQRAPGMNCDFQIAVDDRVGQPPNAFQTVDRDGQPVLVFNLALIATAENADELAFVMGHEAAHHIAGHLPRTQQNAAAGAVLLSGLVAMTGGSAQAIRSAQDIGASVGARSFSKEFELEADQLGTVIAARAGYDPVRGAAFFTRIPDPGDRFLGSHPPNAARIETVRRTAAGL